MAKISIEYRVKINEVIYKNLRVFITGSIPELGNWLPLKSKQLTRQEVNKTHNYEVWSTEVTHSLVNVKYRYFIANMDDNYECRDERCMTISSWESNLVPRKKDIYSELLNNTLNAETSLDIYGYIDDHMRLLRGWLLDQTAVQIRVCRSDSIRLYKTRNMLKRMFLKCHHFQIRREDWHSDDDDDVDNDAQGCRQASMRSMRCLWPPSASCSTASIPVMTNGLGTSSSSGLQYHSASVTKLCEGFHEPRPTPPEGIEYKDDYVTFHFETMNLEDTGIELEIWQMAADVSRPVTPSHSTLKVNEVQDDKGLALPSSLPPMASSNLEPVVRSRTPSPDSMVLVGVARLALMPHDRVIKTVPLYSRSNRPVGEIKIDFIAVHPLMGHRFTMETTYQKHWKHRKTLDVGHKGSGTSYGNTSVSAVRENTLYSLRHAFEHGADFVEFDVQLSKDLVPVVYHDFTVALLLRRKRKNDLQYMKVPVKDLVLRDLHALKVDHTSVLDNEEPHNSIDTEDIDSAELLLFPTLRSCLETIDISLGFNIELKYPQDLEDGASEQSNYVNRNVFVDQVLKVVMTSARKRRIIFSSFDPDVCLMVNLKQNMYPVMFLAQGDTTRYERYKDPRTHTLEKSMFFVLNSNLLGMCVFSRALSESPVMVERILDHKLILFLWGEENNDSDSQANWKSRGVHGIIFDRIHEFKEHGSKNVFTLDHNSNGYDVTSDIGS